MSRGAQSFRQVDVTKAVKGAVNAGLAVKRVEIDNKIGNIVLYAGRIDDLAGSINEWDDVK
jgi:hypothetical protein